MIERTILSLSALVASAVFIPTFAHAVPNPASAGPADDCRASLLMDAASGEVLSEDNGHQSLPPASMVKVMLAYVTLKRLQEGGLKLEDPVLVSANASKTGGSQVYLKQNETFSVGALLEAVLIQSANDAATALAEHIGGTREGFVDMMNAEAKALGMNESVFHSPHGLPPAEGQEPDLVSAYDFALLSRAVMSKYPEILKYTSKTESDFRDGAFKMSNHNHLLRHYQGADGLKTGYYSQAGFSITATAQRNGVRMIAIVMGCKDRKNRDAQAARLLSTGISQFRSVSLLEKGMPVDETVEIAGGEKPQVIPVAGGPFTAYVKSGEEAKVARKVNPCAGLQAPVAANTPCGEVSFFLGERELGKVPLVIPEDVPTGGIITRIRNRFGI